MLKLKDRKKRPITIQHANETGRAAAVIQRADAVMMSSPLVTFWMLQWVSDFNLEGEMGDFADQFKAYKIYSNQKWAGITSIYKKLWAEWIAGRQMRCRMLLLSGGLVSSPRVSAGVQ